MNLQSKSVDLFVNIYKPSLCQGILKRTVLRNVPSKASGTKC